MPLVDPLTVAAEDQPLSGHDLAVPEAIVL
jgi:hypothetical protein